MRGFKRKKGKNKKARRQASRSPKRVQIARPPSNPHQHASKVAEAAVRAWHRRRGAANLEVPLSVLAILSLIAPPPGQHNAVAGQLLALHPHELATLARTQWRIFVNGRPDLINRVWPLMRIWYTEPPLDDDTLRAAKSAADAAVRAGLLDLTGDALRRREADLFGPLLTYLRPESAIMGLGQVYTPGDMADFMGRMLTPEEDESVHEPCAGTGGMFRAAALAMREKGRDPTTVEWSAIDIDHLAIACLAVNVVLWDLGYKVLLGVGNSLKGDEWRTRAIAERRETIELVQTIRRDQLMIQAVRDAQALITAVETDRICGPTPVRRVRATRSRGWHRRKS